MVKKDLNYPKYLSIQTTSLCNGRCIFCPYDEIRDRFPSNIMEDGLFKKIIDECSLYPQAERIIIYLNNEPLTDPRIVERINYAKEKVPWASVHILTNASLLTAELAEGLINSKLDWIGISLHGIKKETVEKSMGLDYELTFGRALDFIDKAKLRRNVKEFIMVTFLRHKYLSLEEKDEAVKFWRNKGIERISYFDGPVSRAGNVRGLPQVHHDKICGCDSIWANEMIHIVENGDVILCCMDWKREVILGSVRRQTVCDVWNSAEYYRIREMRDGRVDSPADFICKRCESATVKQGDKKDADVLLVMLPPWGTDSPPLGIACLSSYLKTQGVKAEVFDFNIELFHKSKSEHKYLWQMNYAHLWRQQEEFKKIYDLFSEEIEKTVVKIAGCPAKVIGFSLPSNCSDYLVIHFIKRVKELAPDKIIVCGGVSASIAEQRGFIEGEVPGLVDVFVLGEGEQALLDVVKAAALNKTIKDIPATLTYQDGGYCLGGPKPRQLDLDSLPFPTFEEFNLSDYRSKESLLLEFSRGCIGNCTFCDFKAVSEHYRIKSPAYIISQIKYYIAQYNVRHFSLCDSALNGNVKQLAELCDLVIRKGIQVRFSGLAIPHAKMNKDLLNKMKKAGFYRLEYGLESGSDKTLKAMGKIFSCRDAEQAIRNTFESGIQTLLYLLVGFPGETRKELEETKDFLRRNAGFITMVRSINPLYIMAGSRIRRDYRQYGVTIPESDGDSRWFCGDNTYEQRAERVRGLKDLLDKLGVAYTEDAECIDFVKHGDTNSAQQFKQSSAADVLLTTCPPWGVENPPVGLAYLANYARRQGLRVKVIDFNVLLYNKFKDDFHHLWHVENKNFWSNENTFRILLRLFDKEIDRYVDEILSLNTSLIGFSVVDPKERITVEVIKRIRRRNGSCRIIIGGPATSTPQQRQFFLDNLKDSVSGFVIGEGEATLCDCIEVVRSGGNLEGIPGVMSCGNGKMRYVPRPLMENLDQLAYPDYQDFNFDYYESKAKTLILEWSRGCIGRCSFCKGRTLVDKYRHRRAASIVEELKFHIAQRDIRDFTICDSLVNGNIRELESICDAIIKEGLKISWTAQAIPLAAMTADLLRKMRKAGCWKLQWGVESGSEKVLKNMNKMLFTPPEVGRLLCESHKAGILNELFILVGFPGEDEREFQKTVRFIKDNRRYIAAIKSINAVHIVPGTDLYENAGEYGVVMPVSDPHYRWYADGGNDYLLRNRRIADLLSLASNYKIKVWETNISEGKQYAFRDTCVEDGAIFGELKKQIDNLRSLCAGESAAARGLLSKFVVYVSRQGLFRAYKKTVTHLYYLYQRFLIFIGERKSSRHICNFFDSLKDNSDLIGFFSGYLLHRGANMMQIDLTNDCNNSCIGCWCYSPLLEGRPAGLKRQREVMPFKSVKNVIHELHNLGVGRIILSGGGEPLMHPNIGEVIDLLREKDIPTTIITSFVLADEGIVRKISAWDNCELYVSLWAASPETYTATHPNKSAETFSRIKELLMLLSDLRSTRGHARLKLINVICNKNYFEIEQMIDLALEVGADLIEFVPVDTMAGKTDSLLLSRRQKEELLAIIQRIRERIQDGIYVDERGHSISLNGDINLWERFTERIGNFTPQSGIYDRGSVDRFPCYAGWAYSRIKSNGDVIPCCKAEKYRVGNIYKDSFARIWNSPAQRRFRYFSRNFPKSHAYFSDLNCYKICDNVNMNFDFHARLSALTPAQKAALKFLAWFDSLVKRFKPVLRNRSCRFVALLILLFLKVVADIYMLFLRLFCRRRIFPGG